MESIHGGDIYRNRVRTDFSVNVNPLGMPKAVKDALREAADACEKYPDIAAERLKHAVSAMAAVSEEYLLFGNGASELFMAAVHAIRPKKTVIPVPSFYGYEYAANAADGEIIYYSMKEETGFLPGENFTEWLPGDTELLFLANPNNPTGKLLNKAYLRELLRYCKEKNIYVVLDECFMDFCGRDASMLPETGQYENLLLVRAFTKIFAIPGVRLGYMVCSSAPLLAKVGRQIPEWNLSTFAQEAGVVCAAQTAFIEQSVAYVKEERCFLEDGLRRLGIEVFPGEANFLFLRSEKFLYERLLERGVLIRDCQNFRGLSKGYYRIAVKNREENEALLNMIGALN